MFVITQESSYVITSRVIVCDQLENHQTWPPWDTKCVSTSRTSSSTSRSERESVYQNLKSLRKTSYSNHKVTTLQCCQHCPGQVSRNRYVIVMLVSFFVLHSNNLITWKFPSVKGVNLYTKSNLSGPISCLKITPRETWWKPLTWTYEALVLN